MTVLIIGAGIAGLTAALSLHQIGVPCRVFESVETIEPLGVGINTLPHAVRELTELGLRDALDATGIPTAALAYYNKHGQFICSEPRGLAAGYNWPQFSLHRGTLQSLLLQAVRGRMPPDTVLSGHHLAGWETTATGLRASFVHRRSGRSLGAFDGTILIGADGIHSAVRSRLYPEEGAPVWKGVILWRGISRAPPFLGGRTMVMVGHQQQKFVAYPIVRAPEGDDVAVVNWIAERKFPPDYVWRREDWNRAGRQADFLPQFESWRFDWLDIPGLIRAADRCFEYPMVDRDPLSQWTFGPVTLLGDAAHPMYPIGSNGASQAILDARVLARAIRTHGPTEAALGEYEAERRPATTAIVLANRQHGPDRVMELVEQRAPDGFAQVEDVLPASELDAIAASYKRLAGFDKDALNGRPSILARDPGG